MDPARNALLRVAFLVFATLSFQVTAFPQRGGGHTLFGDFRVDESEVSELKPVSFHLILYTASGGVLERQTIVSGGRYRFMKVRNGEYDIVVEMENAEVARIHILLTNPVRTDIRQDISLEWRMPPGASRQSTAIVSVAALYTRDRANQGRFDKAQAAIKKKDFAQAATLLRHIVDNDPGDFPTWTELGTVYLLLENPGEAEKSYLRATEVPTAFALAHINLARVRVLQKRFDEAIGPLMTALKLQPTSAEVNLLLGEAYLQTKKGSTAVSYLSEAARLGRPEAHLRLGVLYNAAGWKEKAAAEYAEFLKKKPDYPDRKKLEQYIAANKPKETTKH